MGIKGFRKRRKRVKLSLCMIVRDNEDTIRRALDSIAPHVDEVVIVDTGSTDSTPRICAEYGKVYVHPWEHDFSLHRNQSLDYASGDWVIYIDSDEELDEKSGPLLKKILEQQIAEHPDTDSVMMHLINWTQDHQNMGSVNLVRCFRRSPTIRFSGRVHNELRGFSHIAATGLTIHHYGYGLDPAAKAKKFLRTTTLLKRSIAEAPDNPVPYHYMAISYHSIGAMQEMGWWAEKSLELQEQRPVGPQLRGWCYYTAETSALERFDFDHFWGLAKRALAEYPDHLDTHALAANAAYLQHDWQRCVEHADKYCEVWDIANKAPQKIGLQSLNTQRQRWKVEFQAAQSMLELGKMIPDIMERFGLAIAHCPDQPAGWREVGSLLSRITPRNP